MIKIKSKQINYFVSAIKYSSGSRNFISKLMVHECNKEGLVNDSFIMTKDEVIEKINNGYTFFTGYKNEEEWLTGEKIEVFNSGINSYLKTILNYLEEDNLGSLPKIY